MLQPKRYRKRCEQQIGMSIQDGFAPLLRDCAQLMAAGEDTDKRTVGDEEPRAGPQAKLGSQRESASRACVALAFQGSMHAFAASCVHRLGLVRVRINMLLTGSRSRWAGCDHETPSHQARKGKAWFSKFDAMHAQGEILDEAHEFVVALADIYDFVSPCFPEKYRSASPVAATCIQIRMANPLGTLRCLDMFGIHPFGTPLPPGCTD